MNIDKKALYGTQKLGRKADLEKDQPRSFKVLIIDDDKWAIRILSKFLDSCGFTVISAADPAEGVAKAVKFTPSLIFLDIIMPDISGDQILKILKKIETTSHIPVIIISGNINEEKLLETYKGGAAAFISKPYTLKVLYEKIEECMGFALFSYLGVTVDTGEE